MATSDYQMKQMHSSVSAAEDTYNRTNNSERALTMDRDEADLGVWGKKQQLKRRFGMISIIGLTCCLMITWEGVLIVMVEGLANGGPQGLICSFIFAWLGVTAQTLVMADMGSMIPVAGGQYNWVAILAPPKYSRFLSYMTGWVTSIAWQAVTASGVYLVATMVATMVAINDPTFAPTQWQMTLMFYAVILVALIVNTFLARVLPQIESMVLLIHVLGFFGILIPLCYLGQKQDASFVFQTFMDLGGWSTKGLTFFVGMNANLLVFIGIDGASHMAEEIENAAEVIPKAMITAVCLNGLTGFGMLIAALYSITNLDNVLLSPYPFMVIFQQATSSNSAAIGMAALITVVMIFASIGVLATASRMLWAFAREKALPGHQWLSKIHTSWALPLVTIGVTVVINMLLALINLGSTAAFNAFTSLTVAAFYLCFILSACSLLWRRLYGEPIRRGPFTLGKFTAPVVIFAVCYSLIGVFFSFWPQFNPPTLEQMNWSSVVLGGSMAFALLWWVVKARHEYTGPIMELTREELAIAEDCTQYR